MITTLPKKNIEKGQSLIGILVALAIFSILSQAIFTVVVTSYNLISFNRARITARHLAQEKIELIRNLPYDNVGTQGGIPPGPLPQTETIERNKLNYTVRTTIIYIDDPFDGVAPSDTLPTDYKRVRVEVSWQGTVSSHNSPVVFLTDIAPKSVETTAGGGTLSIIVFDANGNPVPQANVSIVANSTNPPVNLTLQTSSNGRIILPGAPECNSCYQINVTKTGFSTDRTYSTSEVANPTKPHQTIIERQLTEVSFSIDKLSQLTIKTFNGREDNFTPLGNVNFRLVGNKTIGTDTNGQPVFKFDQNLSTNSSGILTLSNIEWDTYQLLLGSLSPYDITGTNPLQPLSILPDTSVDFSVALSPSSNNFFAAFIDNAGNPIASVSATLSNSDTGFSETKITGLSSEPDFGQVNFSNLTQQDYTLSATAAGYLNFNTNINLPRQIDEIPEKFVLSSQ